ncbi:MAG: deoxyribodipyrimidine photo-lyase [Nitrospirota bacterium]|nr:deoxyribodipyrimidine photo-lyase [Nitrospirota bacterium]
MRGVVWLRRDLRLQDQPALTAACADCDDVIPLFVFDDPLLRSRQFGSPCVTFMLSCLDELAGALAARGLALQWRRGNQIDEVIRFVADVKADAVYWNRDYEPAAIARDRTIQQTLMTRRVAVHTFKDHVVFEAEEIRGSTGDPLQRYSAYRARWWAKWHAATPPLLPSPARLRGQRAGVSSPRIALPTVEDLDYQAVPLSIKPGEKEVRRRLRWFLNGPVHTYVEGRNLPAIDGTSKLSPHFRFGTLSVRTAVHAALGMLATGGHRSRRDVITWIDELIWREFFQQILSAFPQVASGPFRSKDGLPKPRSAGAERKRLYAAWCEGQTGYPLVDAGMRQLNQTGWMHNRVRMVVASFLIKDLRIDWQSGERYFMQQLIDADLAANNGNWQWASSTGTDSMPGYRIFNPMLQSRKFDPEGTYARQYVPELAAVPTDRIHDPHLMTQEEQALAGCRIGIDYPSPIVDHRQAREEYIALGKLQGAR